MTTARDDESSTVETPRHGRVNPGHEAEVHQDSISTESESLLHNHGPSPREQRPSSGSEEEPSSRTQPTGGNITLRTREEERRWIQRMDDAEWRGLCELRSAASSHPKTLSGRPPSSGSSQRTAVGPVAPGHAGLLGTDLEPPDPSPVVGPGPAGSGTARLADPEPPDPSPASGIGGSREVPNQEVGTDHHRLAGNSGSGSVSRDNEQSSVGHPTYLYVPYAQIAEAKRLGACYDGAKRRWYAPGAEPHLLQRWGMPVPAQDRTYLAVPFKDNQRARELGAQWDRRASCWYDPSADRRLLVHWPPALVKSEPAAKGARIYLRVPYGDKERAKGLGARWDARKRMWYCPAGTTDSQRERLCAQWGANNQEGTPRQVSSKSRGPPTGAPGRHPGKHRAYLDVPYGEKTEAKSCGARWDSRKRLWYCPSDASEDQRGQLCARWGATASQERTISKAKAEVGRDTLPPNWPHAAGATATQAAMAQQPQDQPARPTAAVADG